MTRTEITMRFVLEDLKQPSSAYGYDIWLPNLVSSGTLLWRCALEILKSEPPPPYTPPTFGVVRQLSYGAETQETKTAGEVYPLAADIIWLLCRQGILRPGVRSHDGQAVSSGEGYSLTTRGREWVKNCSEEAIQEMLRVL